MIPILIVFGCLAYIGMGLSSYWIYIYFDFFDCPDDSVPLSIFWPIGLPIVLVIIASQKLSKHAKSKRLENEKRAKALARARGIAIEEEEVKKALGAQRSEYR